MIDLNPLQRSQEKTGNRRGNRRGGIQQLALYGVLALAALAALTWAWVAMRTIGTIEDLLQKNEKLQLAILELTTEEEIGSARILERWTEDGQIWQRIRLVERVRGQSDEAFRVREFTLPGEEIYFDALIVKFDGQLVLDGKERALFIWRRLFSEALAPSEGIILEEPGAEPERYRDWLTRLPLRERRLFWSEIWALSHQPRQLEALGIRAIYGNAVYQRMEPGRSYRLMINSSGQIYPFVDRDPVHD